MSDRQFHIKDWPQKGSTLFIDCFGSGEYLIEVRGKDVLFEWSDQFGPLPINKDGSECLSIGPRHKFWRNASLWNLQGKRLEGNRAIWHEPRKPVLEHLGGRHYRVIEPGEIGHDW